MQIGGPLENDAAPALAGSSDVASALDSQLRCPTCDYNLTGIADQPVEAGVDYRCPECGNRFDPEQVKAILAGAPASIPIWDDPATDVIGRFVRMCLLTWFAPHRLARMFPKRCRVTSVRRFARTVLVLAWTPCVLTTAVVAHPLAGAGLAIVLLFVWPGIVAVEKLFAAVLMPPVTETPQPPAVSREYWDGMMPFFRSFLLLETVSLGVSALGFELRNDFVGGAGFIGAWLVPVWWLVALSIAVCNDMVNRRTRQDKVLMIIALPLLLISAGFLLGTCYLALFSVCGALIGL